MKQTTLALTASDLIYLVSCAVDSEKPDTQRVAEMDLDKVYSLSRLHSLTYAAGFALQQAVELPRVFDQSMKKAIRKQALFNIEREKLFDALDAAGIAHMPLKGAVLQRVYPYAAMREMSDNDILCDSSRMEDVKAIMESMGYTCESYGAEHHDIYKKPPTLEFEMHRKLFDEPEFPELVGYYDRVWDRLLPDGVREHGCRMTDEDFYIYLICHLYKHYRFSGSGLRSLLDIYLYNRERYDKMDKDYMAAELDKLGLRSFENDTRTLAQKLFTRQPLSEAEQKELYYYISSGSYGTVERFDYLVLLRTLGDDSGSSKRRYLFKRVFLSGDELREKYPFFSRHKSLYPLLVIYRPVKGALTRPRELGHEYKEIRRFKKKKDAGKYND